MLTWLVTKGQGGEFKRDEAMEVPGSPSWGLDPPLWVMWSHSRVLSRGFLLLLLSFLMVTWGIMTWSEQDQKQEN